MLLERVHVCLPCKLHATAGRIQANRPPCRAQQRGHTTLAVFSAERDGAAPRHLLDAFERLPNGQQFRSLELAKHREGLTRHLQCVAV